MDGSQTNLGSGVALAEGVEPAVADENSPAPKSLKQRLAAIRDESFGIGKDNIKMKSKAGVEFTIKGHTVEAVLSEMRPLLAKHGVDITPNLIERTYTGNRCDVIIDFLFERTDDSDETRTIRWAGAGTDDGDKGFSKAGTNCLKEMLKKRFLITDREDAKEEETSVEHKTDEGLSRATVERSTEQRRQTVELWAKALKAGLEGAKTLKDVERLQRDNKDELSSENLPSVTRTFFMELIQRRQAELKDA